MGKSMLRRIRSCGIGACAYTCDFHSRIGWAHGSDETKPIDDYENDRPTRREQPDLVLSRQEREELLVEWGEAFQDIIDAIRSNIKIKNQRRSTVNAIGRYDRWEEMMESAGRKIKRTIGLQKQQQNYLHMVPPPTHRAPPTQSYQHTQEEDERPAPVQNIIPKKPVRRSSADTPSNAAARQATRELEGLSGDFDDDEKEPPSLVASSAGASENTNHETHDRPELHEQESGLSYDSNRPAALIEVDQLENECDQSAYSVQSGITMSTHHTDGFSEAEDSLTSDGFGKLERDTSYWMVGGMDAPRLLRCHNPTVICEDGSYEHMIQPPIDNWRYQGFGMQPPPYSNSIVNRWE